MVNPYALSSRTAPKSSVSLSQSQALKKFEKFEAKLSGSLERRAKSPDKKPGATSRISLDSSNEDDVSIDDENDDVSKDEDSIFMKNLRSSNRFLKVNTTF